MTSSYPPGEELARAVIDVLRADSNFDTLLFPSWAPPRAGTNDDRVYTASAYLPENAAFRDTLPRILVEPTWTPAQYEQDAGILQGAVSLFVHIVVPQDQEEYGAMLAAALMQLLLSTQLSSPRIIAAGLYLTDQQRPKQRIAAFKGAWEYMVQFRSANVGVLQ